MRFRFAFPIAILVLACWPAAQEPAAERELVLFNGKIVTLDARSTIASAMTIRGSRIVAVGTDAEARASARPGATHVDLQGRTVIPGLIDTHAHLDMQALARLRINFAGARSIPEMLQRIKAETERQAPGTWIVTEPVGEPPFWFNPPAALVEKRYPDRRDLDTVSPNHPVYIRGPLVKSVTVSIANSLALKLAGITRDTPAPKGVTIVKDAHGEPTGVFEERVWPMVVQSTLFSMIPGTAANLYGWPRPGLDQTAELLKQTIADNAAFGLTGVYEGHGMVPESLAAYRKLHDAGELRLRVSSPLPIDASRPIDEIERSMDLMAAFTGEGLGDEWLRIAGASNINFSGSAHLGSVKRITDEKFFQIIEAAARRRLRLHVNIGEQGFDQVMKMYEDVDRRHPIRDLRFVLYHVSFPSLTSLETMKRLNVLPTAVPNFIYANATDWLRVYSEEKVQQAVPLNSLLKAGIRVSLGSDMSPGSPMFSLSQALRRVDGQSGHVIGKQEKITREEALRAHSTNAAYLSFQEDNLGSLETGKFADLAVLSRDILTCAETEIANIRSLLTLVGGKVSHRQAPFDNLP